MLVMNVVQLAFATSPVSKESCSQHSIFTYSCFQVLVSLDNGNASLVTDFIAPCVILVV